MIGHADQEGHPQPLRRAGAIPRQAEQEARGKRVAPSRGFPAQLGEDGRNLRIGVDRRLARLTDDAGEVRRPATDRVQGISPGGHEELEDTAAQGAPQALPASCGPSAARR